MAGLSSHRCPAWRASGLRFRKTTGHGARNRQAGSSAVSEARRNRRALANDDTSDDALLDSKYRVVPRPRAAGDSAICLVDCLLLSRQRDATALDYMSPYGGRDLASQLLCTGNTSPFRAEIFLKPAPKIGAEKTAPAGRRCAGAIVFCCVWQRAGTRERSLIRPARAGSATVVCMEHRSMFSTACDLC
jgi:hypothetical protein